MKSSVRKKAIFGKMVTQATYILKDKEKLGDILNDSEIKAEQKPMNIAKEMWDSFSEKVALFVKMLRAYRRGEYKVVPLRTLVLAAAALIYFLTPFDFIPDFLVFVGILDDISIVFWVSKSISSDLNAFQQYLNSKSQTIEVTN